MVLLVFIAEYPHIRFFFNIPGWVIGRGHRRDPGAGLRREPPVALLINFLLGLLLTALVARALGTDGGVARVPQIRFGGVRAKAKRPRRHGPAPAGGGTVVTGPWQPTADAARLA